MAKSPPLSPSEAKKDKARKRKTETPAQRQLRELREATKQAKEDLKREKEEVKQVEDAEKLQNLVARPKSKKEKPTTKEISNLAPYGVYLAKDTFGTDSLPELAGYLHFPDTTELRIWMGQEPMFPPVPDEPEAESSATGASEKKKGKRPIAAEKELIPTPVSEILDQYQAFSKANFGITRTSNANNEVKGVVPSAPGFMSFLKKDLTPEMLSWDIDDPDFSLDPKIFTKEPRKGDRRCHLITALLAQKLFKIDTQDAEGNNEHFTGAHADKYKREWCGYQAEDWHRAYNLFRQDNRLRTKPSKSTKTKQTVLAVEAEFVTIDSFNKATPEQERQEALATAALKRSKDTALREAASRSIANFDKMTNEQQEEQITKLEKNSHHLIRKLAEAGHENKFPAANLAKETIRDILDSIGEDSRAFYEGPHGEESLDKAIASMMQAWQPNSTSGTSEGAATDAIMAHANNEGLRIGEENNVTSAMQEEQAEEAQTFSTLHQTLNAIGSVGPSFEIAKAMLLAKEQIAPPEDGRPPADEHRVWWNGLWLYPWQVVGISWANEMLSLAPKTAVIADDTGLGKTVQACGTVLHRIDTMEMDHKLAVEQSKELDFRGSPPVEPRYKPSLVCAPPQAVAVWKDELKKYFPQFRAKMWLGSKHKAEAHDKEDIIGVSYKELEAFCGDLDPTDATTGRTLIITSYSTFTARAGKNLKKMVETPTGKMLTRPVSRAIPEPASMESTAEDDEDEPEELIPDDDHEEFAEMTESEMKNYVLDVDPDLFMFFIGDEAHKLKNPRTLQHRSLDLMKFSGYIFLTASPFMNSLKDFLGILHFAWKMTKSIYPNIRTFAFPHVADDYNRIYQEMCKFDCAMTAENLQGKEQDIYAVLNLQSYKERIGASIGNDLQVGGRIIPAVFSAISLRRVASQTMKVAGEDYHIGGRIPPPSVVHVELHQSLHGKPIYDPVHNRLFPKKESYTHDSPPKFEGDTHEEEHHVDNVRLRHLVMLTANPALDNFVKKEIPLDAADVQTYMDPNDPSGATLYHQVTCLQPNCPPYADRASMAWYISSCSAKMQYLAKILKKVCIDQDQKVIIYVDWPLNLWLLNMWLSVLCINSVTVCAGQSQLERKAAIDAFNDQPDILAMVASSRAAATSINLQRNCAAIIVVDIVNPNTLLQIIGRVSRIGQTKRPKIWVLTVLETYDQVLQAKNARKMIAQISATARIQVTEEERAALLADPQVNEAIREMNNPQLDVNKLLNNRVKQDKVKALYREWFGLRTDREKWGDAANLHKKDYLPGESRAGQLPFLDNTTSLPFVFKGERYGEEYGELPHPAAAKPPPAERRFPGLGMQELDPDSAMQSMGIPEFGQAYGTLTGRAQLAPLQKRDTTRTSAKNPIMYMNEFGQLYDTPERGAELAAMNRAGAPGGTTQVPTQSGHKRERETVSPGAPEPKKPKPSTDDQGIKRGRTESDDPEEPDPKKQKNQEAQETSVSVPPVQLEPAEANTQQDPPPAENGENGEPSPAHEDDGLEAEVADTIKEEDKRTQQSPIPSLSEFENLGDFPSSPSDLSPVPPSPVASQARTAVPGAAGLADEDEDEDGTHSPPWPSRGLERSPPSSRDGSRRSMRSRPDVDYTTPTASEAFGFSLRLGRGGGRGRSRGRGRGGL